MMTLRSTTLASGAAALALALVVSAILIGFAGPVAAGDQMPFKGRLAGTVTVTPLDPPMAFVLIEGTGNATLLGRFTFEVPDLVNQATRTAEGTYVFTAANGDTVTADFTGEATVMAPGVISTNESGIITGGTGRFAGASGSFAADRVFFVATGMTTGSFKGTISSPGGR